MHTNLFLLSLAAQIPHIHSRSHNARQEPAPPNLPPPTTTDFFSAPAADLISRYIPSSVTALMYERYTSYASTTGDPASIIESAFTAVTPPAWLDTLPSKYQSNIEALESAISMLREEAAQATVPLTVEMTLTPGESGGKAATATPAETGSVTRSESRTSEDEGTQTSAATSTTTNTASDSLEGVLIPVTSTPSIDWGPTESSGLAKATDVPINAIRVIGLVGAVLAL